MDKKGPAEQHGRFDPFYKMTYSKLLPNPTNPPILTHKTDNQAEPSINHHAHIGSLPQQYCEIYLFTTSLVSFRKT